MKKEVKYWCPKIKNMSQEKFKSILDLYKLNKWPIGKTITIGPRIYKKDGYAWAEAWSNHSIDTETGKITTESWATK